MNHLDDFLMFACALIVSINLGVEGFGLWFLEAKGLVFRAIAALAISNTTILLLIWLLFKQDLRMLSLVAMVIGFISYVVARLFVWLLRQVPD